jgi:hypothetical protein
VDDELDRFKRINLSEYAASRGYRLIRSERTRNGGSSRVLKKQPRLG